MNGKYGDHRLGRVYYSKTVECSKGMCRLGLLWSSESHDGIATLQQRGAFMAAAERHAGWDIDLDAARTVFTELLSNSIRHGKGPISTRLECDGGAVRLRITDCGGGFDRVPKTPAPPLSGCGRGLFIVSRYAEDIKLEGDPVGTTVVVTLPRRRAEEP